MYCMNCGVKLADSEKCCPLCGTRAYHPDLPLPNGKPLYPDLSPQVKKFNPYGLLVIVSVMFLLPMVLTLLIDHRVNSEIDWAGYVCGGLVCLYVWAILPTWFRRPNPVIFVPCGFVSIGFYLFYINHLTGGNWFWLFALPLVGGVAIIVTAVITLVRYVRRGYLYIFGGAILLSGALTVVLEHLVNLTFDHAFKFWSLYPLIGCFLVGMLLIVIAICRPLRESLHKKFFL